MFVFHANSVPFEGTTLVQVINRGKNPGNEDAVDSVKGH